MTHATSAAAHANLQSPENKKAVAFSLGTAVAEQIVKSRQYNYATSSIEGEGQTVSEIFSYKQNLRKIVPKQSPMQTVEEQPKVVAAKIIEPAYQVRNKGTDRISRLLSTEMEEEETPRYVSVRLGFMFFLSIFDALLVEVNLVVTNPSLSHKNQSSKTTVQCWT